MAQQWLGRVIEESPFSYRNFIRHHCAEAEAPSITPSQVNRWLVAQSHRAVLRRRGRSWQGRQRQAWVFDGLCSSEWYLDWDNRSSWIAFELKWN